MFGSKREDTPTPAAPEFTPARTERPPDAPRTQRTGGFLSSEVSIDGDLSFRNELIIDGKVHGKINATGALTVGKNARVRGEVRVRSLTVQGTIEGNVFASERCVLEPGATLRGDVESPRLALDENASFLGRAKISANRN
ncbi:MAG TPA: polymer-forming cytoskeletal protein [Chthoniobacterales bacterium]|nr:polymer-forming cytoskeletal protein [Chthoniobacterales bacterium]